MRYIYQHLGLGDHFICNGMVREILKSTPNEYYIMFMKPWYEQSVRRMYSDVKNLSFIAANDPEVHSYLKNTQLQEGQLILIGHIGWKYPESSFEKNFYAQHSVPFNKKWDSFRCPRNEAAENYIVDKYNIHEPYIFVHDDERFRIDRSKLPSGIRLVFPEQGLTPCISDYAKLIENAQEVHCIESSFTFMIDLMGLNRFVAHRYARRLSNIEIPEYRYAKDILE